MNIVECLKVEGCSARVSWSRDRWLVWGEVLECWVVYERKAYARNSTILISTKNEEEAVKVLTEED